MQFEFPWALGPSDGRYLVREQPDAEPAHVLVLATLGAPQRRHLGARRAREVAPEPPPTAVATARATVIDAQPVTPAEAEDWLAEADAASAAAALVVLARAVRAHRIASGDPAVHEPALAQALVVRAGHGGGEQVAEGRWSAARELTPERGRRVRRAVALHPQERLAALLGGHSRTLACEELTLRARHDLDHGHVREAALQLRAALDAALAELPAEAGEVGRTARDAALAELPAEAADAGRGASPALPGERAHAAVSPTLGPRIAELRARRASLDALADDALAGTLAPEAAEVLAETLGRLEAMLRAQAAAGH